MCGNFGLLVVGATGTTGDDVASNLHMSSHVVKKIENEVQLSKKSSKSSQRVKPVSSKDMSALDRSMGASIHKVSKLKGVQCQNGLAETDDKLLSPLKVLEAQTSCTEIRGGQAGGFSTFEYRYQQNNASSGFDAAFCAKTIAIPRATRVRRVALKRYPLAADIAAAYLKERYGKLPDTSGSFTAIGHTRFATSSINIASELHPHEWVPFHDEDVWLFDNTTGRFGRSRSHVGIHITHNGDFDELEAYGHVMLNGEIGHWLDRIHYCSSTAVLGDSPKIAGLMDLLRVQGRWGAAAKAAWVRCATRNPGDVADGEQLDASAPNSFPEPSFWNEWSAFLDRVWTKHINNVILVKAPRMFDIKKKHSYSISYKGTKQLCNAIIDELLKSTEYLVPHMAQQNVEDGQVVNNLHADASSEAKAFGITHWKMPMLRAFVHHTVRGFLHADLYTSLSEVLSRATGSFGIQTHCTLEPGVVVIASKGQPMSISYDEVHPIVLFGSEAEAMAVPVFESGKWLPQRIDLDNKGEIMRIGPPRALIEGTYASAEDHVSNFNKGEAVVKSSTKVISFNSNKKIGKQDVGSAAKPQTTIVTGGVGSKALAAASSSNRSADFEDTSLPISSVYSSKKNKTLEDEQIDDDHSGSSRIPNAYNHESKNDDENDVPLWKTESGSAKRHPKLNLSLASIGRTHSCTITGVKVGLMLECGIEIRGYSLLTRAEASENELKRRSLDITSAPMPYDPEIDLVARDLAITPAVLSTIDEAWKDPTSIESMASRSLCSQLVRNIQHRIKMKDDVTDFVVAGIEASVWLAEQFAADVRRIFPHLNVVCTSTNKLIGFGDDHPSQVFFPAADEVLSRRIDPKRTCVLLISQSGQTFSSLHATRRLAQFLPERIWVLTGCFNSKMEQVLKERYLEIGVKYRGNRVFNNYSGHRPAEPTSVAVAAAWHSLTRLLLDLISTCRRRIPGGRLVHPWDYERAARTIQAWLLFHTSGKNNNKRNGTKKVQIADENLSDTDSNSDDDKTKQQLLKIASKPALTRSNTRRASTQVYSMGAAVAAPTGAKDTSALKRHQVIMKLSDGCIDDLNSILDESLLSSVSEIVGYDIEGEPLESNIAATAKKDEERSSGQTSFTNGFHKPSHQQKMAKIERHLTKAQSSTNNLAISKNRKPKNKDLTVHEQLVEKGRMWGDHINEPWNVMVLAAIYVIGSVCLGLPLFGLIGDGVYTLLKNIPAAEKYVGSSGVLMFTFRYPSIIFNQPIGYTLVGLFLQLIDALFFIYLGKHITRALRIFYGRPFHARMGKRTIVIVDNPTVHQLLENFVSKLYSQSYSVNGVDVHGASGLDHFVHRFTHRVVRGVLLAVGRPDGRLCCLSKSESSLLLAVKQAAFIRNPKFGFEGSGPDIITVGHNPYEPNLGLAHHVVLSGSSSSAGKVAKQNEVGITIHGMTTHGNNNDQSDKYGQLRRQGRGVRRKFVDEYIYARLFIAQKPFTVSILRNLRLSLDERNKENQSKALTNAIKRIKSPRGPSGNGGAAAVSSVLAASKKQTLGGKLRLYPNRKRHTGDDLGFSRHSAHGAHPKTMKAALMARSLPYGAHHIDPSILSKAETIECSVFVDFVVANRDMLTKKILDKGISKSKQKSSDPGVRLAFSGKLDPQARQIQDLQVIVQQFYECRVASLERYIAFCVMFHAMAESSCKPWLSVPWDMARSQSNLRVATTASPISVGAGEEDAGAKLYALKLANKLRRFTVYF